MVGRCISYWEGLFSRAMLVLGRVNGVQKAQASIKKNNHVLYHVY